MSAVLFTKVDRDKAYAYFLRVAHTDGFTLYLLLFNTVYKGKARSPRSEMIREGNLGANRAFDQDHMASWHMDILYAHDVPVHIVGCGMWVVVWLIRDSG